MKVVLDTSTIITYLLSKGDNNFSEIIRLVKQQKIILIVCKEIFSELQITIHSEKIKKSSGYNPRLVAKFIAWYKYNSLFISLQKIDLQKNICTFSGN